MSDKSFGGGNRLRSNSKPREIDVAPTQIVKKAEEIDDDFDNLIVNRTSSLVERRDSGGHMQMSELKMIDTTAKVGAAPTKAVQQ